MQSINKLVTFGFENEHELEHDLEHKPLYSEPKIFDGDGDLTKRWYVYFSYRNPKTGRMKRIKNIYGITNRFKTKSERYTILNIYKRRLLKLLEEGYNPFEDNTELYKRKQTPQEVAKEQPTPQPALQPIQQPTDQPVPQSAQEAKNTDTHGYDDNATKAVVSYATAFDKALLLKTNVAKTVTIKDYQSRLNKFKKWLQEHHQDIQDINDISKKIVLEFLNHIQITSSSRTRNNYRTALRAIFQVLEDNEIISTNIVSSIKPLRSTPKRHKTYSSSQEEAIFHYLQKQDHLLLLYIQFISYNMLRPIEACRLRIKDINLTEKKLSFQSKTKNLKTKIIPDILIKELPSLSSMNPDDFLFTRDGIGGKWDTTDINRRDYFSKRFKKVIKDHFGFDQNYSLYSFRHTFITKLYRKLRTVYSVNEAKSRLMEITGHTNMSTLEKYLRDIDAELPEDYSNLLTTD